MIDDEPDLLEIFAEEFRKAGIAMRTGADPVAALSEFEKSPVPVVITDLRLPRLGGIEILRRIKSLQPMTCVLVISGFVDRENILACFREGASDVFFKPLLSFESLVTEVQHALRRHRRWKETLFDGQDITAAASPHR
jgi:two-component system response regulator PilR (NtrC family)